ncbi:MAG: CZB domain-containing protein, partial [Bacteroidales bacterium]
MKWKNFTLGKKFFIAFTIVVALILFTALRSIIGIGDIIGGADNINLSNKNKNEITQRFNDHLKWAQQVNEFITNPEVTELKVELDPNNCAFGKWYHSDKRKEIENKYPELKAYFDDIEDPHIKLHESANRIKNIFVQADRSMSNTLREAKTAHVEWSLNIQDYLVRGGHVNRLDVEKNPHQCDFGKW